MLLVAVFVAVFVGVQFRSMLMMLDRMQGMTMGDLGVMRGFLMIAGFVVFRGLAMMLGCMLVVGRGVLVMFVDVVFCHGSLPELGHRCARNIASFDEPFATFR